MKKIIISALLVLFTIINVKAYSFNDTISVSNNYINNNVKNEIYLIKEDRVPFIYNNKNISYDNKFITGGLINNYEVNTSKINNLSYLTASFSYWEISGKKISDNSNSDDSNIRVTEYVKKGTKITGKGTYKDPWRFTNMYIVSLFSTDESMGKVNKNKVYAGYLDRVSFEYIPSLGYKYSSNTCGMLNDNNTLTLLSVSDDMDCYVSFEKDMKKITFDNNGGRGCASDSIQKGQAYGDLCTPSKDNYTFDGWYTSKTYETKIESTDIVKNDITLYAKWSLKMYTLVYDTNGGSECSKKNVMQGETYGTLCSTSKCGYNFGGWYDESGNLVTSNTIATKNTVLTARWNNPIESLCSGKTLANCLISNYQTLGLTKISHAATGNQNYATTEYRYQGANPNNYIIFNGETGMWTTGINMDNGVWRIIGVFEVLTPNGNGYTKQYRVKIVRNQIGAAAWDSAGTNNWTKSSLMRTLNSGEYFNRTGTYANNGLTNSARNQISSTKWYIGNIDYNASNGGLLKTAPEVYIQERGASVDSGNSQTWDGKVGLIYIRDYMYASSSCYNDSTKKACDYNNSSCSSNLNTCNTDYRASICRNTNWLYVNSHNLTISPMPTFFNIFHNSIAVSANGEVQPQDTNSAFPGFQPTLYLKSNVTYITGNGSSCFAFEIK